MSDLPHPDSIRLEPFDDMRPVHDGWHTYASEPAMPVQIVHGDGGVATGALIRGEVLIVAGPQVGLTWRVDEETGRVTVRATA